MSARVKDIIGIKQRSWLRALGLHLATVHSKVIISLPTIKNGDVYKWIDTSGEKKIHTCPLNVGKDAGPCSE